MSVQAHADAFLARARTAPGLPQLVVLDGFVPAGQAMPYLLVYLHAETPELPDSRSVQGASERFVMYAYCHSVGGSALAARAVSQRGRGVLLDAVLSVAGRRCFPIRHVESPAVQRDESTGTAVFDQVDIYRLESVPA
ncbi:hypothetical protein ACFOOK_28110 [Micromonospora krabiensis]|uniref:DUF3168 domain-containing protein n=1 Tax=Micromonospora krabiensis TaxID=307121 RepID=A0A1C3N4U7_9ACTN|nr:hypothetical protein [Micromonospora krabiensis]SBV27566.1 hypothetical protein GA0070620_3090 [Micromonospora krabiensis]